MFKPTYLYIKTHNVTGLKYFGKTTQNPFKYKGSGKYWINHIKNYGNDVITEIYGFYIIKELCLNDAIKFSIENDIVNSSLWANLKLEELDGGDTSKTENYIKSLPNVVAKKKLFKWWNNGKEQVFCETPPENYIRGRLYFNNVGSKIGADIQRNKKWINNGIEEMMYNKNLILPEGFVYGRLPSSKQNLPNLKAQGTFWWNNGQISKMSKACPGPDFIRGRLPKITT